MITRIILCLWAIVSVSLGADVSIVSREYGDHIFDDNEFRWSIKNVGTAAVTGVQVYNSSTSAWGSSSHDVDFRSSRTSVPASVPLIYGDASVVGAAGGIAPGGTLVGQFYVRFGGLDGVSYTASINTTFNFRVTFAGGLVKEYSVPFVCALSASYASSNYDRIMTPNPFNFPVFEVTDLAPPSSVGIFGWTGADTFLQIEGPTLGSATFLLAKDGIAYSKDDIVSESVPDGSTFTARMPSGGPVVGSGVAVKESDGHFELMLLVTPPAASGTIDIGGRPETAGAATVTIAGGGTYEITIPASGGVLLEIPDPSGVPDGAAITVTRNGQVVGSGAVHKDSGGSFAEVIMTAGEGDGEAADKNDAVFELEVVSFEDGITNFFLEIDGQTFTPEGGGELEGDPVNGARKTFRVKIPNGEGIISGDDFNWKASGLRDGQIVSGQTVAQGQAPIVPVAFTPDGEMGGIDNEPINGFRDTQTVTVGTPRPSGAAPPSANPYNPTSPDQVAAYQADRKAAADGMRDALKVSGGFGGDGNPSTAQGDAAGKLASGGAGALGQLAGGAGSALGGGLAVASFSSSSPTLSVTLPILGVVTFDTSIYGAWAAVLRLVLLSMLVWYASIGGLSIVRGGFAGR